MIPSDIAHYQITAKGGMGEVYRATDTKLDREVAIKVLPEEFSQHAERLARFEREAKALAALNHPNIAAIYGFEQDEGMRFLVLELVEGETLHELEWVCRDGRKEVLLPEGRYNWLRFSQVGLH